MLLAITILGTHLDPHERILQPFMHKNLAQLAQTWMAHTLISGRPLLPTPSVWRGPPSALGRLLTFAHVDVSKDVSERESVFL
jgi:hypothetical protein